jgi:hypothetical protein
MPVGVVGAAVGDLPAWLAGIAALGGAVVVTGWLLSRRARTRASQRPRGFIESTYPSQPFTIMPQRPMWPPFFSVLFFLPRIRFIFTNEHSPIKRVSAALEVAAYDGPIGDLPSAAPLLNWTDTQHHEIGEWPKGERRRFTMTIRSPSLPHPGTYAARVRLTLRRQTDPPEDADRGIGVSEWVAYLFEYFRVEPTSTVLTFWAVVGTLGAALAALATALVALLH